MLVAGLAAFDMREIRREIPVWQALFNRTQLMVAAGVASSIVHAGDGPLFNFPTGVLLITAGVIAHIFINLGLVAGMVHLDKDLSIRESIRVLLPSPVAGFWILQFVLAGLGAATAAVYEEIGAFVVLFLIPLLLARLSILGARAQQELSEKIRQQQQSLLEASERVFQEREAERNRIAEEIHDGSLQMLAAAAYGCGNASEFIDANRTDLAKEAALTARDAINGAMKALRDSLVDLRKSSVEEGGLVSTIETFANHLSILWGTEINIEATISKEPPLPVALAAVQILQEGLTNALKHAQEAVVTVRISDDDGMVHIVIEDEGVGFDATEEVGADHVGMRLMQERATRIGGRLELDTEPGRGTRLEAILPGAISQ
ncbi:MAG: sensor histidine kinase [Actinobacteria bacterium]|nr:sensor histidine kinase [Actinomycetota bacterium]